MALPNSTRQLESHCLPIDCDVQMASAFPIPGFVEWKNSYVSTQCVTMTRAPRDCGYLDDVNFPIDEYDFSRPLDLHEQTGVEVAVKKLVLFRQEDARVLLRLGSSLSRQISLWTLRAAQ